MIEANRLVLSAKLIFNPKRGPREITALFDEPVWVLTFVWGYVGPGVRVIFCRTWVFIGKIALQDLDSRALDS